MRMLLTILNLVVNEMANKYRQHLDILCEDMINKEVVQGIIEVLDYSSQSRIQFLDIARGWSKCFSRLEHSIADELNLYEGKHLLIVMDFDNDIIGRRTQLKDILDKNPTLANRVFLIGSSSEPEMLKANLNLTGHNDDVGRSLLQDCTEGNTLWNSKDLNHNLDELIRLKQYTKNFITWSFN